MCTYCDNSFQSTTTISLFFKAALQHLVLEWDIGETLLVFTENWYVC